MPSLIQSSVQLFESYKNFVSKNPQITSDCETCLKWLSYFVTGKINNSHVLSELVYCLSNLVVLLNDRIIVKSKDIELPTSGDKLKLWLTILEYCEVFIELSVTKAWGKFGKWIIIVSIQFIKCVTRLLLIYYHKETVIDNPPISQLERNNLDKINYVDTAKFQMDQMAFKLKHSGRLIRTIEASPPLAFRSWKPLEPSMICDNLQTVEQEFNSKLLFAEIIYILKPIIHLGCIGCFGEVSWKSWTIPLCIDLISLNSYKSQYKSKFNQITPKHRMILSRRIVILILYIIRSPFYEKYSKNRINAFLYALSKNVPLAKIICTPLAQYLPFWQSIYFYMWSY